MTMVKEDRGVTFDEDSARIGEIVIASFRNAFGNSSNKKKVRHRFLSLS